MSTQGETSRLSLAHAFSPLSATARISPITMISMTGWLARTAPARVPRRALVACSLLLLLTSAFGCASVGGPGGRAHSRQAGKLERPDAAPQYDVLVAELASLDGDLAGAEAAYLRAATKDPTSGYLQRKLAEVAAKQFELERAAVYGERALALSPGDDDFRLFLGRVYRSLRDVDGAERVLLDSKGQPRSLQAGLQLYQIYLEQSRLPEALALAKKLAEGYPDALGGHMAVATVYQRMGQPRKAEETLRAAVDQVPESFLLYSRIARMRRAAGDREGEVALYYEILELLPRHYPTLISLAEAKADADDVAGAVEVYSELVEYYPDDLQSIRRLAALELSLGLQEEAALGLRDALERHPGEAQLLYALGQLERVVGEYDAAIAMLTRIDESHGLYTEARLQIAAIHEERGDYAEALAELEQVRMLRPNRALDFHTAALRAEAGDFEGGVELLQQLLAESPDDDEVLYQLGVLYGTAQKTDEALDYMLRALEQNPNNPHALNYVGYTWVERGERLDEAEEMILRALQQRPNDGYITDSLGWVYYMKARPLVKGGRHADAVDYLERARQKLNLAAELTGGDPVVSEHLGDVHLLMNDKARALDFYKEAVSFEHRPNEQPDLLDKLEGLQRELGSE